MLAHHALFVLAFGLTLDVSFSVSEPQMGTGLVQSDVHRAIWARFKAHGIDVPFPQRDIRIVAGNPDQNLPGIKAST